MRDGRGVAALVKRARLHRYEARLGNAHPILNHEYFWLADLEAVDTDAPAALRTQKTKPD